LPDLEAELDGLYASPLDEFIKRRNDLASRQAKAGDRESAIRIKQLRKPSVSAWVVNQLARSRQVDILRLIKAGESLERVQAEAMAGSPPKGFVEARQEETAAVKLLLDAAEGLMPAVSAATLDRIATTLRSAATSGEGRAQLKQGRLTQDVEPSGFDVLGLSSVADSSPASGRVDVLKERKRQAELKATELSAEAFEAEREAKELERAAAKAARAAASARQRADAATLAARRLAEEIEQTRKR
jgi:hypothetical protein